MVLYEFEGDNQILSHYLLQMDEVHYLIPISGFSRGISSNTLSMPIFLCVSSKLMSDTHIVQQESGRIALYRISKNVIFYGSALVLLSVRPP